MIDVARVASSQIHNQQSMQFVFLYLIPASLTYLSVPVLNLLSVALQGHFLIYDSFLLTVGTGEKAAEEAYLFVCYAAMVLLCSLRGSVMHRQWLPAWPFIGGMCDLAGLPFVASLMNIVTIAVGTQRLEIKYVFDLQTLIDTSSKLVDDLIPIARASDVRKKATIYAGSDTSLDSWDISKWRTESRNVADQQLVIIQDCSAIVDRALELQSSFQEQQLNEKFVACYSEKLELDDDAQLFHVKNKLASHASDWISTVAKIRDVKARAFAVQAFFKIAERSGIEVASIVIGGLIVFGAVHTTFFYQTAAGISISNYWALDDLFIQSILFAPYAIAALFGLELWFRFVRRSYESDERLSSASLYRTAGTLYRSVLTRPTRLVFYFFGFLLLLAATSGFVGGCSTFEGFKDWDESDSESATVTDETILEDVYLVGTTSRTAIFLKVNDWDKLDDEVPHTFGNVTACIVAGLYPGTHNRLCNWPSQDKVSAFSVAVMDRAQVICHAKVDTCEQPRPSQTQSSPDILQVLNGQQAKMQKIEQHLGRHLPSIQNGILATHRLVHDVETEVVDLQEHVDRHYWKTMKALKSSIHQDSQHSSENEE